MKISIFFKICANLNKKKISTFRNLIWKISDFMKIASYKVKKR